MTDAVAGSVHRGDKLVGTAVGQTRLRGCESGERIVWAIGRAFAVRRDHAEVVGRAGTQTADWGAGELVARAAPRSPSGTGEVVPYAVVVPYSK